MQSRGTDTNGQRVRGGSGLLITFAIGAVLLCVAFVATVIPGPFGRPRARTDRRWSCAMLKCQMIALERYRAELGAYPPGDITLVGGSAVNGTSEVLVHYLGQVQRRQGRAFGPYMAFQQDRLTDEDSDGFEESRDAWGGAYVYAQRTPAPDEDPPRHFDIASPGPDGILGGEMVPGKGYVPATTPEAKALEADNVTSWR